MTVKTLGDYELIRELGRGGMGVVWLAEHKRLKNKYAIKILPEELKNDEQFIQRFHVEAGVMARLDHPNIVKVVNMGREGDVYYIVMEYIHDEDGETRALDDLIKEKKEFSQEYVKNILQQVCDGLIYAHDYKDDQIKDGVIHRDIKPGNVFIRNGREAKISDFGLARIVGNEYLSSRIQESISISIASRTMTGEKTSSGDIKGIASSDLSDDTLSGGRTQTPKPKYQKTSTGALLGTYDFMSPEQRRGEEADKRSDIYALGILIYKFMTGDVPTGFFKLPSEIKKNISKKWDSIIWKCLQKEPLDRYQTVADIRSEMGKIGSVSMRRIAALALSSILALILLSLVFTMKKEPRPPVPPPAISTPQPINPSTHQPTLRWKDDREPPKTLSWKESRKFAVEFFGTGGSGISHYLTRLNKKGEWRRLNDARWNLEPFLEGVHTLEVKAVDHDNRESEALAAILEVVNNPPIVKWENVPEEGGVIRIPPFKTAKISCFDRDGEVVERYFSWGTPEKGIKVSGNVFEIKDIAPGEQVLHSWVVDDGGKKSEILRRRFIVMKNNPPVLEARLKKSEITEGETARLVIERAEDPDGGSVKVEYRIIGWTWQDVTRGSEELRALSSFGLGVYAIEVLATDEDNGETKKTLNLTIQIETRYYMEDYSGLNMKIIWIEGGSFQMGYSASEEGRLNSVGPVHTVELDGFWLGETEVTQRQWKAIMIINPSRFKGDDLPVENVSWEDAMEFCRKLSEKTGKRYTLPSEAQWEYACRAGSLTRYCFGDSDSQLGEYAWSYSNSGSKTQRVKQKKPNRFGLYDMHGNVREWCMDWYGGDYYANSPRLNPTGPSSGLNRVHRGGSWNDPERSCRSANRFFSSPSIRYNYLGFRVCLQAGGR